MLATAVALQEKPKLAHPGPRIPGTGGPWLVMAARSREKRLCAGAGGPGCRRVPVSGGGGKPGVWGRPGLPVEVGRGYGPGNGKAEEGGPRKCEASALWERFLFLNCFCVSRTRSSAEFFTSNCWHSYWRVGNL